MVVAPGRMIDSFLSIPDAESLPLYRMVLKLACVCVCVEQCGMISNIHVTWGVILQCRSFHTDSRLSRHCMGPV